MPAAIDDLISRMESLLAPLVEADDQRRHFHATYTRTTTAVRKEIKRGGFLDGDWTERWDVAFAGLYLDALERWDRGEEPSGPWRVAFEATRGPRIRPVRLVLLGMNAHVNYDLPQALLSVITDREFDDPSVVARRAADHEHIDGILASRVAEEDKELKKIERAGERSMLDRLLTPFNRSGTKKFLKEARAKVWRNARALSLARRRGPEALAARLAELEELARARVADLYAPGQVILKLARGGFGVLLPG